MTCLAESKRCGLWAALPYRDGGSISDRSSRRVWRQCASLGCLFGGGLLLTVVRWPGRTGVDAASNDISFVRAASAEITAAGIELPALDFTSHLSREEARRVLELLRRRLSANGTEIVAGTAATEIVAAQCNQAYGCCDGVCKTREEYDLETELGNQFLFVNPKHLKDPNKPRLKYEDSGELVYHFCWYLFGIFYMFAALAIVCDEFFVPALECFVDEFQISMDVAGATFMAAGGSMPELVTSFIATFKENNMGFSAIVGSAVFNVLFVIAVCALASGETLLLNWWPLLRDCTCYLTTLITVAFVFKVSTPDQIELWEAMLLFFEYCCYCLFMKFNHRIHERVMARFFASKGSQVTPEANEVERSSSRSPSMEDGDMNPNFLKPSTFRKGIVHLLTQNRYLYETAGIAAVTQVAGDLEETFAKLDTNHDGKLSGEEIQALLVKLGVKHPDSASMRTAVRRINRTAEDEVSFDAFKRWYLASEARIEVEIQKVFIELDTNKTGMIEKEEIAELLRKLGHKPSDEEIDQVMRDLADTSVQDIKQTVTGGSMPSASSSSSKSVAGCTTSIASPDNGSPVPPTPESISLEQFEEWYRGSMFFRTKKQHQEFQEDIAENGALTLEAPEEASLWAMGWYLFTYPIVAMLYCTLPDIRQEKWNRNYKVAIAEFSLCLVWIAIFCLLLIECTQVVSNTVGLSEDLAAITVLAAGTSIPDLLSSYIVARNGEGDMAVSSSIGSNIFDVTIGLPLPWMTYCISKSISSGESRTVTVKSPTLGFSMILLIVMLALVFGTIVVCRWRLTKCLGWCMLLFYIFFVLQDVLNNLNVFGSALEF